MIQPHPQSIYKVTYKPIKVCVSLLVTDYNKHVHFRLHPIYLTPCTAAFTDFNLEHLAYLYSEIVTAVISHLFFFFCFFPPKHCGLYCYFNYQYSGGPFFFLPQCSCFPVPWQPIALTAAINRLCYMLLWWFGWEGGRTGIKVGGKYKSQYPLSLSSSLLFLFFRTFTLPWHPIKIVQCTASLWPTTSKHNVCHAIRMINVHYDTNVVLISSTV